MFLKADVAVIGAGVVGLFTAYMLSTRLGLDTVVVEREREPGLGVSARTANVIHVLQPPFDSLKSRLCLRGNRLYRGLARELGVRLVETRTILAATRTAQKPLAWLVARMVRRLTGFPAHYMTGARIRDLEPEASDNIVAGVVVEGYAVVDYESLRTSLARKVGEHAELLLEAPAEKIEYDGTRIHITTPQGKVSAALAVNAAGLYADQVAALAGDHRYRIRPLKGVMTIHDRPRPRNILAPLEVTGKETKGGGAIPQADGSLLLGPNNAGPADREDHTYTEKDIEWLINRFQPLLSREIPRPKRVVVGLRPTTPERDFIIEWGSRAPIIHLVGIESPGLTAAPAIAELVARMIQRRRHVH